MATRISRRFLLRGAGVALALPALEIMSHAGEPSGAPVRFVGLFTPHGMHMPSWTPNNQGPLASLPTTLLPLDAHKAKINVLSRFENHPASITTQQFAGSHARGTGAFLTSQRLAFTDNFNEITNGISLDQVMADALKNETPLPSLELGVRGGSSTGDCEDGYSCAYLHNISWYGAGQPAPKETDPRALYDRLASVHTPDAGVDPNAGDLANARDLKVLDSVLDEAGTLRNRLGGRDQAKLDEYLESVYEVERRLEDFGGTASSCGELPPKPGEPSNYEDHLRLLLDLVALAFECDLTRVATLMMENPFSSRSYDFLGIGDDHHYLSHHGGSSSKIDKIKTINTFHTEQVAYFLDRLSMVPEGGGTLLDNSMVMFSSEFGDGDDHYHHDLPVLLAGAGGGAFETGRHIQVSNDRPIADLGLTMLQTMGLPDTSFGEDGTSVVTELFA